MHFISIYNRQSAIADHDRPQSIKIDAKFFKKDQKRREKNQKKKKEEQSAHKEKSNILMKVNEGKIVDGS